MRAVCFHGHFYQPPREHPWLGVVEPEASAAPARDWNVRILRECYAPHAAARVLDGRGKVQALVDLYARTSFDFGPTLLAWLAPSAPALMGALRAADAAQRARTGHGGAWGQPFVHAILPLTSAADARTLVHWGRRDFEHRFGRPAEGMWLPEMAVDEASLLALADAGVTMTILAPHQARRIRPLGGGEAAWAPVTAETLDVGRLYRCVLPAGRSIDVLFRDAAISQDVAFGSLLADGARLAERLVGALEGRDGPAVLGVAVDGETYGHHHRFGEMALAYALRALERRGDVELVGPLAYRARQPPRHEVEIRSDTSWSCPHGVERWRADCGCRTSAPPTWSQAWRGPLRSAIDWLRDELDRLYAECAGDVLRDPAEARNRYVDCILEPDSRPGFLAREAGRSLSARESVAAWRALEMARHALLMQTSCGWFFDDLASLEPILVLRQAARALELAADLGRHLEDEFVARLEPARSNVVTEGDGGEVWRRHVRPARTGPGRVAATGALLAGIGQPPWLPGWRIIPQGGPGGGERVVGVEDLATGMRTAVTVAIDRDQDGTLTARTAEGAFGPDALFGVQRERLLVAVGRQAVALGRAREVLAAIVAPASWLGDQLSTLVARRLDGLPETAGEAVSLVDLAQAAGVTLDLLEAQRRLLAWWETAPEAARALDAVETLRVRLGVAPEGHGG